MNMKTITVDTVPVPVMILVFFGVIFIAMAIDARNKHNENE